MFIYTYVAPGTPLTYKLVTFRFACTGRRTATFTTFYATSCCYFNRFSCTHEVCRTRFMFIYTSAITPLTSAQVASCKSYISLPTGVCRTRFMFIYTSAITPLASAQVASVSLPTGVSCHFSRSCTRSLLSFQ